MYETIVKIDGMMCGMCESHINDVIRKTCNPKKVKSSAKKNQATILSEDELDLNALEKAIEATGYHYVSAESKPYEKKGLFH